MSGVAVLCNFQPSRMILVARSTLFGFVAYTAGPRSDHARGGALTVVPHFKNVVGKFD